jgi:hypothetical protein
MRVDVDRNIDVSVDTAVPDDFAERREAVLEALCPKSSKKTASRRMHIQRG